MQTLFIYNRVANIIVELYNTTAPLREVSSQTWMLNKNITATDLMVTLMIDGMIFGYAGPVLPVCFVPEYSSDTEKYILDSQKALVR